MYSLIYKIYKIMNINKLRDAVANSKLNKVQLAEKCGFTRVTLDNVLQGGDAKISTIETLARVLGVSVASFFDDSADKDDTIKKYQEEIERLQSLLDKQKQMSTKVIVELDVTQDEFIKMGLKDKVIQILNK